VDWLASCRSVQFVGGTHTEPAAVPLATATIVGFVVRAAAGNAGAGVVLDAWFAWNPDPRTAAAPSRVIPEIATTTISAAVLLPVATVTVVEVVFGTRASRTNTLRVSADAL
jgi:hypothetical protein